jgi:hypothetical protein
MMVQLGLAGGIFKYNKITGAGLQTATLAFGGDLPPYTGATEEYDGTSWATSPGSLNTARYILAGAGIQTAALAFGGGIPPADNSSNRRMDRSRSSCNKNNYSKLTGGKYGNKNIHRS